MIAENIAGTFTASVVTAGNLPAEPNSFIGRERDLAELVAMLGRVRALTLCGPGGIGKTRLALQLAATLGPEYQDGAWIADLADADLADMELASPVEDDDDPAGLARSRVIALVTTALGIRQEPDRPLADTLIEALRSRSMLLVLDTCEHLVDSCAELVQRLLSGCPNVRVIATSREPLRVRGEVIWRVPPLGLPPAIEAADGAPSINDLAESESMRLFEARAAAVRPGFRLDPANVTAVAEVCRTLDGLPLAIELAAARARTLSAEQIQARLADRFELLALGDRTAPPRQQTLRAAVEWSYDLLTDAERMLLSRLAVFHGWSLDMAELVCANDQIAVADVLGLLTALIDKSLVSLDGELNGDARYRLLDTVRELAAEQAVGAGEMARLRVAQRDCMLAMAEQIASMAYVRGDPSWSERVAMYHKIRAERANFNLALACCVQRAEAEEGLRLCYALAGSFLASGEVAEGAGWIDRLLALAAGVAPGIRARAHAIRAELAFEQQDFAGVADHARACLELSEACGDGNPASALRLLALLGLVGGRPGEATELADRAVIAARQMGDEWEEGVALAARAAVIAGHGRLTDAEYAYQQALETLKDNNGWGVANVLYGLGQVAKGRGDSAGAAQYFANALTMYRQIDARPEMTRCLAGIGRIALATANLPAARASLTESMRLSLATGHRLAIARGLQALAALESAAGNLARAVLLGGAAMTVFEATGARQSAAATARMDVLLAAAAAEFGAEEAAALLARGRELSPHQAAQLVPAEDDAQAGPDTEAGSFRTRDPLGHPAPQPAAGPLTAREHQVAELVASGLTNRAIGQQLFISQTTAARHVANIFGKLGFKSRAQIVAWIAERASPDSASTDPASPENTAPQ